ncbi:MAG: hypothetical protein L6Q78_06200 [Bacteroidia bacterium]|nr:hypothetical protein [Bacteroidia bacterium]
MKQLFLLFLLLMLIFSCKREEPITEHIYHYLDAKYLAISPYFNNPEIDTLQFVSNTGDTQVFIKTHIDTTWYIVNSSQAEGPTYLSHYEQRRANFKCIKGDGYLQVLLVTSIDYPNVSNSMVISYCDYQFCYRFSWWDRRFENTLTQINFQFFRWLNRTYYLGFNVPQYENINPNLYHSEKEGIFLIQDSVKNINYTLNN